MKSEMACCFLGSEPSPPSSPATGYRAGIEWTAKIWLGVTCGYGTLTPGWVADMWMEGRPAAWHDGLESIAEIHPAVKSADIFPKMRALTEDDLEAIAGHILLQPAIVAEKWGGGKIYY